MGRALPILIVCAAIGACDSKDDRADEIRAMMNEPEDVQVPASGGGSSGGESSSSGEEGETTGRSLTGPMTGVYKFVDDQGVTHYVDSLSKVPKRYRKRAHHPTGGNLTILPATPIDDLLEKHGLADKTFFDSGGKKKKKKRRKAKPEAARHGNVFLYTTSWCPACKRARSYLESQNVSFIEKDVERSRGDLQEMLEKSRGARGVPVIDVYGKILRGFNPGKIDRALQK
jgi:glutaredoxin 3